MSWTSIFRKPKEAIVEIEEAYIRFVVPDKNGYTAKSVNTTPADLLSTFRQNLSTMLGDVRQLSIVTNHQTGNKILPFPTGMDNKEILEHLQLKREEYFGMKGECDFFLRPTACGNKDTVEYLVSYIQKSFFNRIKQICQEEGLILNTVTNIVEAMIGAYNAQTGGKHKDLACLLSIGYVNLNMVVLKAGQPVAVRTSLTGSVKEIENRLMSVMKLSKADVEELITGKAEADQHSIEILQQNERELLSRISPFFAYIRSIDANAKALTIYLTMPYISLPGLPSLLEKNFSAGVVTLASAKTDNFKTEGNKADINWLTGALHRSVMSFTIVRPEFLRFSLNARMAWMFIIFFMFAPLGLSKLNINNVKNHLEALKNRYSEVENLFRQSEQNIAQFDRLKELGALIEGETQKAFPISPITAKVFGLFDSNLRLDKFTMNRHSGLFNLSGTAIDNESALKLWDSMEKLPEFANVRINFADRRDNAFPKFTISAELRKN